MRNILLNILYFLFSIIIGIILVPFYIKNLGLAAYGIIPLITSLTSYIFLITSAFNRSASRYLTINLQNGDDIQSNKIFNTYLIIIFILCLILLPIIFYISEHLPTFFNINAELKADSIIFFRSVMGSFLITAFGSIFMASLYARNRLDLYNSVHLLNIITQTILIIFFLTFYSPKLFYIGIAYIIGSLIAFSLNIFLWLRLTPELKINFRYFDKRILNKISGMGLWILIDQIGALLFIQIDLIIVNKLFGSLGGGEYAIAFQWSVLLRSMALVLSGVLAPIILIYYANQKFREIIQVSKSAVKLMGLSMALPIGLICGLSTQLLSLWVGPEYINLAPLLIILVGHLTLNLSVLPLFSINVAFNKVRVPGIVTCITGVGDFLLALLLPIIFGWGMYGVAVAGMIMLTLKNTIFIPWYSSKILKIPTFSLIRSMIPGTALMVSIALSAATIGHYIFVSSWFIIILLSIGISIVYLIIVWNALLNSYERKLISSFMPLKL